MRRLADERERVKSRKWRAEIEDLRCGHQEARRQFARQLAEVQKEAEADADERWWLRERVAELEVEARRLREQHLAHDREMEVVEKKHASEREASEALQLEVEQLKRVHEDTQMLREAEADADERRRLRERVAELEAQMAMLRVRAEQAEEDRSSVEAEKNEAEKRLAMIQEGLLQAATVQQELMHASQSAAAATAELEVKPACNNAWQSVLVWQLKKEIGTLREKGGR